MISIGASAAITRFQHTFSQQLRQYLLFTCGYDRIVHVYTCNEFTHRTENIDLWSWPTWSNTRSCLNHSFTGGTNKQAFPVNMVDITIADGSRFRHSPFRKAYKYLFERPLRLHDLKEHLLIIHDTLHVYSFTLRGGVISYNQIRRRRAEPVTHSKSHLPVAEPKSHAAIDEGGHTMVVHNVSW